MDSEIVRIGWMGGGLGGVGGIKIRHPSDAAFRCFLVLCYFFFFLRSIIYLHLCMGGVFL